MLSAIAGKAKISESNIEETLAEVKTPIIGDVNFKVVKEFVAKVKENLWERKSFAESIPVSNSSKLSMMNWYRLWVPRILSWLLRRKTPRGSGGGVKRPR